MIISTIRYKYKYNIWEADLADMQLIKKFVFYYVLPIFSVNTHGLFLWKIKKVLQLQMLFKKFQKNLIANQTNYE